MKDGLIFGLVAWILSLILMPFLAPLFFQGDDMEMVGYVWFGASLVVIFVPCFFYGYLKSTQKRPKSK